jgi:hypothetical protein
MAQACDTAVNSGWYIVLFLQHTSTIRATSVVKPCMSHTPASVRLRQKESYLDQVICCIGILQLGWTRDNIFGAQRPAPNDSEKKETRAIEKGEFLAASKDARSTLKIAGEAAEATTEESV